MKEIIIVLDVGGTTITAATASIDPIVISNTLVYHSKSKENAHKIVNHFVTIIHDVFNLLEQSQQRCVGISIGFPGPFDYANGISYMKNIDKFDALYNFPFKENLTKALCTKPLQNQKDSIPIVFANDASLFALGEYERLAPSGVKRLMGITLGTGCGSTFIDSGQFVASQYGIPNDGMIYHKRYRDSIIDDYISKRGILKIANRYGYDDEPVEVSDIYYDASKNNSYALAVFFNFGYDLLYALREIIENFKPDVIVFGGQISKAYNFFGQQFSRYTDFKGIEVVISPDTVNSALVGACRFFLSADH